MLILITLLYSNTEILLWQCSFWLLQTKTIVQMKRQTMRMKGKSYYERIIWYMFRLEMKPWLVSYLQKFFVSLVYSQRKKRQKEIIIIGKAIKNIFETNHDSRWQEPIWVNALITGQTDTTLFNIQNTAIISANIQYIINKQQ